MRRHWWIADDGGLVFEDRPLPRSEPEWHSVPELLREQEVDIDRLWNPELAAVEALREQAVAGKPHVKSLVTKPSHPAGTAGPVMTTNERLGVAYQDPAYTAAELREVEQQGKIAPRMLSLVES